jgi:hypothetical protein
MLTYTVVGSTNLHGIFHGSHGDRTNVITILRQIMKICRELGIREGRPARRPRFRACFGVASNPSGP